jgi:nicotinamidase-related amidase
MADDLTARFADDDVLIVVDVQNDFCPGGALEVPRGDEVVPIINRLAAKFRTVVLTQDWHPRGHSSFASSHRGKRPFDTIAATYGSQMLWPDHCVQSTHPTRAVLSDAGYFAKRVTLSLALRSSGDAGRGFERG